MSTLHKAPYGFLGALALKTLGRSPNVVRDELAPTIELSDFYLADQLDIVTSSFTITGPATSGVTALAVPQGRAYRVLAYSLEATFAAGDAALTSSVYVAINQGGGVGGSTYLPRTAAGTVTGAGLRVLGEFADRILLPAGFGMSGGLVLSGAPGTPVPCVFSALVHNFEN